MSTMQRSVRQSLLDITIAAAVPDTATVSAAGTSIQRLTHGVTIRRLPTHTDARGSVMELFDTRWPEHQDPMVFSYTFTIRPGVVKGWALHRRHQDRYVLLQGEMQLVLFDPRPDSPTYGELDRCLVNVPIDVWHADYNIGSRDIVGINFPTITYDHNAPDKLRLPLDTPLIPFSFPVGTTGG
jgi:dTDP-4-dehydrorhamnose 3,5-epimerase